MRAFFIIFALTTLLLTGCGQPTRTKELIDTANPLTTVSTRPVSNAPTSFASFRDVAVAYNISLGQAFNEHQLQDKLQKYVHPSMLDMKRKRLTNGYMVIGKNKVYDDVIFMHTKLDRNGRTCTRGFTVRVTRNVDTLMVATLFDVVIRMTGVNDADQVYSALALAPGEHRVYVDPETNVVYVMAIDDQGASISFLITNCLDAAE